MSVRQPPPFFEPIQQESASRWDKLERDPGLAGPWRQLFMQVRSPRHVLSELLQNADDAGATWARARVDDQGLTFEHNGSDFTEEQLRSLCQFGHSNKRHLHTIGFRGLGFKSCFGCGSRVQLITPSLALEFREERFTEPVWLPDAQGTANTIVRIPGVGREIRNALQDEFYRWSASPIPLLFFKHLVEVELGDGRLKREVEAPGPAKGSLWVRLGGLTSSRALLMTSEPETPPSEVVEEVRRERGDREFDLPPLEVALVLGAGPSAIFVVLPTTVIISSAFSIQGPFLQDPARTGIKDPAHSPTNRWLLDRAGRLAAAALASWIGNPRLTSKEQSQAYSLLPPTEAPALVGVASAVRTRVHEAMQRELLKHSIVLAGDGSLRPGARVLDVPSSLVGIWDDAELLRVFGENETHVIHHAIEDRFRDRLSAWGLLKRCNSQRIISGLTRMAPRKPSGEYLVRLWSYLYPILRTMARDSGRVLHIVPASGADSLTVASEARPFRVLASDVSADELATLSRYVTLADPEWLDRLVPDDPQKALPSDGDARELLRILRLDRSASTADVLEAAADRGLSKGVTRRDAIQLASFAAKSDSPVRDNFLYFTEDGRRRQAKDGVLWALPHIAAEALPDGWSESHVLHPDYYQGDPFLQSPRWRSWLSSRASGLWHFPPPLPKKRAIPIHAKLETLVQSRGGQLPSAFPLSSAEFEVVDFDFDQQLVEKWTSPEGPSPWPAVAAAIGEQWSDAWNARAWLKASQSGRKHQYDIRIGQAISAWVDRLRSVPCVPDTNGSPSIPSTLLRRTASNAFLEGLEPFVSPAFEERCSPDFLDLLGVRVEGGNVDALLERLRALATQDQPDQALLFELYRALDRASLRLNSDESARLSSDFAVDRLIRTDDAGWETTAGVFRTNPSRIPGAAEVWAQVKGLGLWSRLGVESAPTGRHLLMWMQSLSTDVRLPEPDRNRVRQILAHQGDLVWTELESWLSISGHWTPKGNLEWVAIARGPTDGLFDHVRRSIADASMLPSAARAAELLKGLKSFDESLSFDPSPYGEQQEEPPAWLQVIGTAIARLDPSNGAWVNDHDRAAGIRLASTHWRPCEDLEITPELDGRSAGVECEVQAAWIAQDLFVRGSTARHHSELVSELGRQFRSDEIRAAVEHCIGREQAWIEEYFTSRWKLLAANVALEARGPVLLPAAVQKATPTVEEIRTTSPPRDAAAQPTSGDPVGGRRSRSGPAWQEVLSQYLAGKGFQAQGDFFRGANGDVVRLREDLMHATRYDADGKVARRYWVCDGALDSGVEMPAEIWHAVRQNPSLHTLLVPKSREIVAAFNCAELVGRVEEYPIRYRIKLPSD